ncbi:MAG: hypothetical protein ACLQUZ_19225 [Rhizomicrobium sp.]
MNFRAARGSVYAALLGTTGVALNMPAHAQSASQSAPGVQQLAANDEGVQQLEEIWP